MSEEHEPERYYRCERCQVTVPSLAMFDNHECVVGESHTDEEDLVYSTVDHEEGGEEFVIEM